MAKISGDKKGGSMGRGVGAQRARRQSTKAWHKARGR